MMATENIKRQETTLLIIPVKETVFLMAMGFDVGGINIQDDLFGWGIMTVEKDVGEQVGEFLQVWHHLVIAGITGLPGMFQPVEGGLSSHICRDFIFWC